MQDAYLIGTSCTRFGKQPGASFKDLTRQAYLAVLADAGLDDGGAIANAWFGNCGMAQFGQAAVRPCIVNTIRMAIAIPSPR